MPTATSSPSAAPELKPISNALEAMSTPGFGPEQADIRVVSSEYVSFDYAGQFKDDPFVAVKWNCSPIDGSNEGKDFDIEWVTGAKMSDFAIINDGGALASVGSRLTLTNTSNWALLLKALADASFDSKALDGPEGIRYFVGGEFTLRQIPQPTREGIESKNAKGYVNKYYTCLKIISLPGEAKKGGARKAAPKPAATPTTSAASRATMGQSASTNGSSGSPEAIDLIIQAATSTGGSIAVKDIGKAVFQLAKTGGKAVAESQSLGKQAMDVAFLTENSTDEEFNVRWEVSGDTLTLST